MYCLSIGCKGSLYGRGYPTGAKGVEIPVGARILAICDSIDAMTSNRCYRKSLSFETCYDEIEKNLGKMYDPIIGRYVLDNWEEIIDVVKNENNCEKTITKAYEMECGN